MRLDETVSNVSQNTTDNLGFGAETEVEALPSEPCWPMLVDNLCDRCGKRVAEILEEK